MFKEIFTRELRYTLSFPLPLIALLVFSGCSIFLYSRGIVFVNTLVDKEMVNSPHAICANLLFFSLLAIMVALPIFYNAGNREYQNGFNEILFTTSINKASFFFGRFFGAFCLLLLPMIILMGINVLGVYLGLSMGSILPEEMMAFRLGTFIRILIYIILPNAFIVGSLLFAMTVLFKNFGFPVLGALILNMLYLLASMGLSSDLNDAPLAALVDPFGEFAFNLDSRYHSALERNTQELLLTGHLLKNRLLWLTISSAILFLAYWKFSFQYHYKTGKKTGSANSKVTPLILNQSFPKVHSNFTASVAWKSFKSFFKINFLNSVSHVTFRLLLILFCLLIIFDFLNRHHDYGVAQLPLTYIIIELVNSSRIMLLLLLIYLTGEMVWDNRQVAIDEIIDSTAHHSSLVVLSKVMAAWAALLLAFVIVFLLGIGLQLSQGFTRIELSHYATELGIQIAPIFFFWTCYSVFIQMLVNHKFIGYACILFTIIGQGFLFDFMDWESNMLWLGNNGAYIFSDLNAYGPFLKNNLWFGLYWSLFGAVLLVPAALLWARGKENNWQQRIQKIKGRWNPVFIKVSGALFALWLLTAGFVFYNTKILNHYSTSINSNDLKERYERQYKKYENAALPQITDARFFIDFFPEERNLRTKTLLTLMNKTPQNIDTLFFSIRNDNRNNGWKEQIKIPGAQLLLDDRQQGFQMFLLDQSLEAQDSIVIETIANYTSRGFENAVEETGILDNGSFLNHAQIIPHIGYRKEGEIRSKKLRKERGLPSRLDSPLLALNPSSPACQVNYLTDQHSWITMETILSTSADQTGVTSGSLLRQWREKDRRYFHYKVDHPSLLFNNFISARYEIARRKWQDFDLEIYYDKKHDRNIEVMLDEMENAMTYYTQNFGPYFHKQVRILEFPQYGNYAQAFPGTMPYSESRGFVLDFDKTRDNNPIASTVGHEIGHQWWAHQLIGANMQGSAMLSESFAEYSSLMIMKKTVGPDQMIDFLKYDYDDYLRSRNRSSQREKPLYKVEDQPYIYYRKGSVVLYALAAMIGEEKVNRSLRRFLEAYRYQEAPFPRSIDYLQYLEQEIPDSLNYLLRDLFYDITLYDNSIENASCQLLHNGQYQLDLQVRTYKIKMDEEGQENEVAISDWMEIGIYADERKEKKIQLLSKKLDQKEMHFSILLDQKPDVVVLDPRFLFFDRSRDNNEVRISMKRRN